MATRMADYLCVTDFAPCQHGGRDGERGLHYPLPFTLRLSLFHQSLLTRKTLDRNPKTRQERADLGLIRLHDESLHIGFRAE